MTAALDHARAVWRLPGCSADCREGFAYVTNERALRRIYEHDIWAHEEFGRRSTSSEQPTITTGPLTIDRRRRRLTVNGREVIATPIEWALLLTLAAHAGVPVSHAALLRAGWGPAYAAYAIPRHPGVGGGTYEVHQLRVSIARLRARLGEARHLIVTDKGYGYHLEGGDDGST